MSVEEFFTLFLAELRSTPALTSYYKLLASPASFEFRKAYLEQRLRYILAHLPARRDVALWDCGCGYGTTAIFLALNGYRVHGTTLEFYYAQLESRLRYWGQFGDVAGFTYSYENLFDAPPPPASYDHIIIQDTLHHLEPLPEALGIFRRALRPGGSLIVVEENGGNLPQRLKLYLRRGNRRIIELHDERLGKNILIGNENIRDLATWRRELTRQGLRVPAGEVQYIRLFPPFMFRNNNTPQLLARENELWRRSPLLREKLFFGLNFTATRSEQ